MLVVVVHALEVVWFKPRDACPGAHLDYVVDELGEDCAIASCAEEFWNAAQAAEPGSRDA